MNITIGERGDNAFKNILKSQKVGLMVYIPFLAFVILTALARVNFQLNLKTVLVGIILPILLVSYYFVYSTFKNASFLKKAITSIAIIDNSTIEVSCSRTLFSKGLDYTFDKKNIVLEKIDYVSDRPKTQTTYLLTDK